VLLCERLPHAEHRVVRGNQLDVVGLLCGLSAAASADVPDRRADLRFAVHRHAQLRVEQRVRRRRERLLLAHRHLGDQVARLHAGMPREQADERCRLQVALDRLLFLPGGRHDDLHVAVLLRRRPPLGVRHAALRDADAPRDAVTNAR
jgi:hypothetical protein